MKALKKVFGWILLLLVNSGMGFTLYRFIPDLTVRLDSYAQGTGPLIIFILFAVVGIYLGIMVVQNKLAKWTGVDGNIVLGVLCALLAGGAITAILAVQWYNGIYTNTWMGLGFMVFVGIAAGGMGFMGAWAR